MEIWRFTDQEIRAVELSKGSISETRQAKKQAYLDNGGVILNPNALDDLYEASKAFMESMRDTSNRQWATCHREQLESSVWQALKKVEGN